MGNQKRSSNTKKLNLNSSIDFDGIRKTHLKCGEIYYMTDALDDNDNFKFVCVFCKKVHFSNITKFINHVGNCQLNTKLDAEEHDPLQTDELRLNNDDEKNDIYDAINRANDITIENEGISTSTIALYYHKNQYRRIFKCAYYDRTYNYEISLKRHLRKKHGNINNATTILTLNENSHEEKPLDKMEKSQGDETANHPRYDSNDDDDNDIITDDDKTKDIHILQKKYNLQENNTTEKDSTGESNLCKNKRVNPDSKKFTCDYCDKTYYWRDSLIRHLRRMHANKSLNKKQSIDEEIMNVATEKPFKCKLCDKSFRTSKSRKIHRETHNENRPRPYKCHLCSHTFPHRSYLALHIRRHFPDNKRITCTYCTKVFYSNAERISHEYVHTGEKSYQCDKCGNLFGAKAQLNTHIKKKHSIRKLFKCDQCDKLFKERYFLKDHYTIHTREKPYTCNVCNAKFSRKNSLKQHKNIHSNFAKYSCKICNKKFKQNAGFYIHMKSHDKVLGKV